MSLAHFERRQVLKLALPCPAGSMAGSWMLCDNDSDCYEAHEVAVSTSAAAPSDGAGPHECLVNADAAVEDDGASVMSVSTTSDASSFEALSPTCSWQELERAAATGVAARSDDTRELLSRFFGGSAEGGAAVIGQRQPQGLAAMEEVRPQQQPVLTVQLEISGDDDDDACGRVKLVLGRVDSPLPCTPLQPAVACGLAQAAAAGSGIDATPSPTSHPEVLDTTTNSSNSNKHHRPLSAAAAHLRVLPWLLPGLIAIVIGHLASHSSADSSSSSSSYTNSSSFHGPRPIVVSACGASGSDAMQLVFANYSSCAGTQGAAGCSAMSDWGSSGGWSSDSYSA